MKTKTSNKLVNTPTKVSDDIWFYKNKKTVDFVVWILDKGHGRYAIQFRIRKSKFN